MNNIYKIHANWEQFSGDSSAKMPHQSSHLAARISFNGPFCVALIFDHQYRTVSVPVFLYTIYLSSLFLLLLNSSFSVFVTRESISCSAAGRIVLLLIIQLFILWLSHYIYSGISIHTI